MEIVDNVEEISGKVENVVYRNEDNDYSVIEISTDDGKLETAVGTIPRVFEGEVLKLRGSWSYHKEFGRQFSFTSFEKSLPDDLEGILQYLSSGTIKGVGPVTALKIVNKFGIDSFEVIEDHPEWLADIPGITRKKAAQISESFRSQSELRGVMMFFKDFISTGEITRVYKQLGASAVGMISENPYMLCGGSYGIPFDKVDGMAASLGFPPDHAERIFSGIEYVLNYNAVTNGHTCLPKDKLISAAAQMLGIEEVKVGNSLEDFISYGELGQYSDGKSIFVMTRQTEENESFLANRLIELSRGASRLTSADISSLIEAVEVGMCIKYADKQREALFRCINRGVTVITGGPGTGKTTIVKGIISLFSKLGFKTALAAPTGRAAKRLSEATSMEAKTIHRLLEMERSDTSAEAHFIRNASFPIDEEVVIVDEASMVDLVLMTALVKAMRRGSRLVLIGDSDQLPSVGAGNVLYDIISSGTVETIKLTEIFRQSEQSLIVTNAHNINKGIPPVLNVTDKDFFFVRRENERDVPETIARLITERLPRTYGNDIREQIQVISPSKRGSCGVDELNRSLQERINPAAKFKKERLAHGTVFREGDRVMQTVNDYEIEWEKNGVDGLGIFNGDIGVIESINPSGETLDIWFDDKLVHYGFDKLDELELSYAITVHKSQGSEYPVVIIPMYACAPMLLSRNLFYTAVTRAKKMVILVGRSDIPARMVANNREVLRYTTLSYRLMEST